MKPLMLLAVAFLACSSSGPEACVAAGGTCVLGSIACARRGSADCNPDRNPGGAFCCLSCSGGGDAGSALVCE